MSNIGLAEIYFHGQQVQSIRDASGKVHVVIKRICENLGIDVSSQLKKLKDKPWAAVVMITTTASDGKCYEMSTLPLDQLPMWLAGIDIDRVADHVRPMLIRYQTECRDALAAYWFDGGAVNPRKARAVDQHKIENERKKRDTIALAEQRRSLQFAVTMAKGSKDERFARQTQRWAAEKMRELFGSPVEPDANEQQVIAQKSAEEEIEPEITPSNKIWALVIQSSAVVTVQQAAAHAGISEQAAQQVFTELCVQQVVKPVFGGYVSFWSDPKQLKLPSAPPRPS